MELPKGEYKALYFNVKKAVSFTIGVKLNNVVSEHSVVYLTCRQSQWKHNHAISSKFIEVQISFCRLTVSIFSDELLSRLIHVRL